MIRLRRDSPDKFRFESAQATVWIVIGLEAGADDVIDVLQGLVDIQFSARSTFAELQVAGAGGPGI